jgi:hypothetical protein
MKRLATVLIVLFTATTLFAGEGKSCNVKKASAKSVELTGTLSSADGNTVFRAADGKSYTVCHKTSADLSELSNQTVQVKGKVVSCDEAEGEELVIHSAKRV